MNDKFEYRQISEAYSQIKEDQWDRNPGEGKRGPFDGLRDYGQPIGDYKPHDNLVKILFLEGGKYMVAIYRTNQATVYGELIGEVIEIPSGQKVAQVAISPDDIGIKGLPEDPQY